jgi:hypothetical protein
MFIGLAVDLSMRVPDLVGALANAVFQSLLHHLSTPCLLEKHFSNAKLWLTKR